MFRFFVIVATLFVISDAKLRRISLFKLDSTPQLLKKVCINLEDVYSSNDNLSSILLPNVLNVKYTATLITFGNLVDNWQLAKMIFDIGSSNVWILSRKCSLPICNNFLTRYDSSQSSTYIANGTSIQMEYLTYSVEGFLSTDVLNIAGVVIQNQTFAEITNVSNVQKFASVDYDGIIGLGYSNTSVNGVTPIFNNMIEQGLVSSPIFSLYLIRGSSSKKWFHDGELIFGGSDSAYYQGNLTYIPVSRKGYWQFIMDKIVVNDIILCKKSCQAIVDWSTSLIIGPKKDITFINKYIGTINFYGVERVDCDKIYQLPTISFILNNKVFDLTSEDYIIKFPNGGKMMCASSFVSLDLREFDWILGEPFLTRYYTEFDMENDRVGFALAK